MYKIPGPQPYRISSAWAQAQTKEWSVIEPPHVAQNSHAHAHYSLSPEDQGPRPKALGSSQNICNAYATLVNADGDHAPLIP